MTMVKLTALAMTRERERGTMEKLLATPVLPVEVMVGKNLALRCDWLRAAFSNHGRSVAVVRRPLEDSFTLLMR